MDQYFRFKEVRLINKFQLLSLITKYGIQLVKHTPGKVTVQIGAWSIYEDKLSHLIAQLRREDEIDFIEVNGNTITVQFNPEIMSDDVQVRRLLSFINEYDL